MRSIYGPKIRGTGMCGAGAAVGTALAPGGAAGALDVADGAGVGCASRSGVTEPERCGGGAAGAAAIEPADAAIGAPPAAGEVSAGGSGPSLGGVIDGAAGTGGAAGSPPVSGDGWISTVPGRLHSVPPGSSSAATTSTVRSASPGRTKRMAMARASQTPRIAGCTSGCVQAAARLAWSQPVSQLSRGYAASIAATSAYHRATSSAVWSLAPVMRCRTTRWASSTAAAW